MAHRQPKVSVIVPIYNVEKYLRQCLDSLINQTLQDIEILLIDDGSTDSSGKIADEYVKKDARFKVFHRPNGGYGKAMNFGLSQARGEYIGIVESDDFVDADMFEKLYNTAKQQQVQVVKSNFYAYVTKTNTDTLTTIIPEQDINQIINPTKKQGIFLSMPAIWAAIYERAFIEKHRIRFLETPGASYQDTAFNFKIWALAERVYLLPQAFLHYRQDNENSSINNPKKVFCVCDEWHEIEQFAQKLATYNTLKFLIPRLKWASYMWNFNRLKFPLNYRFLKTFSSEFKQHLRDDLITAPYFEPRLKRKVKKLSKHPVLFFIKRALKRRK